METVLRVLLIRFGIIAAVLVVVALVIFGVALWLKRRGRLGAAKAKAAPLVRGAANYLSDRSNRTGSKWSGFAGPALGAAGRYLDDRDENHEHSPRGHNDRRDAR